MKVFAFVILLVSAVLVKSKQTVIKPVSPLKCSENQTYVECAEFCPRSCRMEPKQSKCTGVCISCICIEDHVLDEITGNCILKKDCPINEKCPPYSHLDDPCIEKRCIDNAPSKVSDKICPKECIAQCECDEGYNYENNKCVPANGNVKGETKFFV